MDDSSDSTGDERSRRRFLAALGAGAAAGVAGCMGSPSSTEAAGGTPGTTATDPGTTVGEMAGTATVDRDVPATNTSSAPGESPYTQVYRQTIDSTVLIRVFTDTGNGQGSGFVWDENHIVTNQHVVEGATGVEVRFAKNDWRSAEVVGTDAYSDLAVLRIEDVPEYATPLPLVETEPPIGTQVVVLGNPFGFGGSVSEGIISGINRSLQGPNNFLIPDAVQTDAAVNPGNSGGPMVTLDGRVVGTVNSGGGDNLGFAISAALMKRVIPALIERGSYEHSYMGVRLLGVSPTIAEANDLEKVSGVLMVEVVDGGPSDGVLQGSPGETRVNGQLVPVGGDVVVKMGDKKIQGQSDLSTYLALQTRPGDTIPVEVIRDGERTTVDLTLGSRPEV